MGLLASAMQERRSRVTPGESLANPKSAWFLDMFGLSPATAGVNVTEHNALTMSAFWCAVNAISVDTAKLPIGVFTNEGEDDRRRLPNDPVAILLNREPSPDCIPITFRQTITAHALTWGNGYAEIEWYNNGRPAALWGLLPSDCQPVRDRDGKVYYEVNSERYGKTVTLEPADMFHIHGLGFDGLCGYSVVKMARESLALTMATEKFGAAFFGNGSHVSGVLQHPGKLKDQGAAIKKSIEESHRGPGKARGTLVLEEGMEWKQTGIPPDDGQFLQTRQFQIPEIARWFRMPPHKLFDLLRGTFSNIEHQSIEYVTDCLEPWIIRVEQEAGRKLFGKNDPRYIKHNVAALVRGDMESRYRAYAIGRQWGFINVDEIRALEDKNKLPDGQGQIYLTPSNMIPADKVAELTDAQIQAKNKPAPASKPPAADPNNGNQNRSAFRAFLEGSAVVLQDAIARTIRVEADKLKRNSKRPDFQAWTQAFYAEHRDHVRGAVFPFAEAIASIAAATAKPGVDANALATAIADRQAAASRAMLAGAAEPTEIARRIEAITPELAVERTAAEITALTATIGAEP